MSIGSDDAQIQFSEHVETPHNECNEVLPKRSIQNFAGKPEEIQAPSALDQLVLSSAATQSMKICKNHSFRDFKFFFISLNSLSKIEVF